MSVGFTLLMIAFFMAIITYFGGAFIASDLDWIVNSTLDQRVGVMIGFVLCYIIVVIMAVGGPPSRPSRMR